jgi:hypothetical protein
MTGEMEGRGHTDAELAMLLRASGGLPIIQIVLDPASDATSIRSAGVDSAAIPAFLLRLGRALGGEAGASAGSRPVDPVGGSPPTGGDGGPSGPVAGSVR